MRNYCTRPFALGDKVLVQVNIGYNRTRNERPDLDGTVVKLGRKWATLEVEGAYAYEKYQVEIANGRGKSEGQFPAGYRAWHPEDRESDKARREVWSRISTNLKAREWPEAYSDEQLAQVAAILEKPAELDRLDW